MSQRTNEFNQPIGEEVRNWTGAKYPTRTPMEGTFCKIVALSVDLHDELFEAFSMSGNEGLWTYMPVGPFDSKDEFRAWIEAVFDKEDPLFYAILHKQTGKALGIASYLRITPIHGVIEVGNIAFSPEIQKTPIATEAMFLMMKRAFNELGYRRYEWKCDALNAPSRRAAKRFGFSYDGMFKQAIIYKGRNRDTAWFSILDSDWANIERGFSKWLCSDNFDEEGHQKQKLSDLISSNGYVP